MLPLADERAEALLASVPEERRTECWWLVSRDGTPIPGHQGGGVLLLTHLRLTRPLGRMLGWLRVSPIVDLGDKVLSRARGPLSKWVPDGPAPRRFP